MQFCSPLLRGRLIKRYKRFLADVVLDDGGAEITATVPNTGSMMGLADPGLAVWLSTNDSPTRNYRHTLELVELSSSAGAADDAAKPKWRKGPRGMAPPVPAAKGADEPVLVGINTGSPNKIVREAIDAGRIDGLTGYASLRNEVRYGVNSRIDMLLEDPAKGCCYVEVKNVHLLRAPRLAEFPDSVTDRGVKHLAELANMVDAGHRAVMVYLIQRGDCDRLAFASDIDPAYADACRQARAKGVEAVACRCTVTTAGIVFDRTVEIVV